MTGTGYPLIDAVDVAGLVALTWPASRDVLPAEMATATPTEAREMLRLTVDRLNHTRALDRALFDSAPTLDRSERAAVRSWLAHTATALRRSDDRSNSAGIEVATERALAGLDSTRGTLFVAPVFAGRLPMVALASDMGERHPLGRLVVEAAASSELSIEGEKRCEGLFSGRRGVVLLAESLAGARLAEVWAHELAHGLDPDLEAVDPVERERFAETLTPLLLRNEPTTVAGARPHITAALADRQRDRDPEQFPAAGFESALIFGACAATLRSAPQETHREDVNEAVLDLEPAGVGAAA